MDKNSLIEFVNGLIPLWESGKIHTPCHFPGGNEEQLIEYFKNVGKDDWVFSTWRSYYHWLLKTGDKEYLLNKILNEANSMHIIDLSRKFISSAIVGGTCNMAVGTAYALKLAGKAHHVHCFIGDGGCDQGWFWEALRYARGWNLPVTFIVEDNNRSVCTDVKLRWGREDKVMPYQSEIAGHKVYYYKYKPTYPHCGTGQFVRLM